MSHNSTTDEYITKENLEQINKMAFHALKKMKQPSSFSFEDMVDEGIWVMIKKVIPNYIPEGQPGHKAGFKTLLTVCLRNHYIGMMKKSFRAPSQTAELKTRSPIDDVHFRLVVEDIMMVLTKSERIYLGLVITEGERKAVRSKLNISFHVESRIRRSIQDKVTKHMPEKFGEF
jgi:hypothetical protein